ncbi:unnamed protein product, partial [Mesorhabditis spiculigera]
MGYTMLRLPVSMDFASTPREPTLFWRRRNNDSDLNQIRFNDDNNNINNIINMADQHQDNERRVSMREQFRLQEELEAAKEKLEKQDKKLEDVKAMLEDSQAHNRNLAVERNIARCDMDHATYERNRELRKACFELLMTDRVPEGWPGTRKWEEDNRKYEERKRQQEHDEAGGPGPSRHQKY